MSFLYTVWFCLRRLAFVLLFFVTHNGYISQHQCLVGLLFVQTIYFAYITEFRPHIEHVFNNIELFNELLLVLIIYSMTGFTVSDGPSLIDVNQLWSIGYFSIALIILVYVINFVFMIWVHFTKVKTHYKEAKYKWRKKKLVEKNLK